MLICIHVSWYIFICNYFYKHKISFFLFFFFFLYFSQVKWKPTLILAKLIITLGLFIPNTTWKSKEISDSLYSLYESQFSSFWPCHMRIVPWLITLESKILSIIYFLLHHINTFLNFLPFSLPQYFIIIIIIIIISFLFLPKENNFNSTKKIYCYIYLFYYGTITCTVKCVILISLVAGKV